MVWQQVSQHWVLQRCNVTDRAGVVTLPMVAQIPCSTTGAPGMRDPIVRNHAHALKYALARAYESTLHGPWLGKYASVGIWIHNCQTLLSPLFIQTASIHETLPIHFGCKLKGQLGRTTRLEKLLSIRCRTPTMPTNLVCFVLLLCPALRMKLVGGQSGSKYKFYIYLLTQKDTQRCSGCPCLCRYSFRSIMTHTN